MAALSFAQRFIDRNCPFIHTARAGALLRVVDSLMGGARLNLSGLGRGLAGAGRTKSKIKLADRLLGNAHLHRERGAVYEAMVRWVLSTRSRPVIAVEWSDVELGHRCQLIKAAVAIEGRALTLYEEVHHTSGGSRARAEKHFLRRLAAMVPEGCRPIIVSDAGFHGPWFRQVRALGWDYVGRLRNRLGVRLLDEEDWRLISDLYPQASAKALELGTGELSKRDVYRARLCLVRGYRPRRGRRRGDSAKNPKWREPWLLATSLDPREASAAQIVAVYSKRMQIEETFRDLKETRSGFALVYARCGTIARREALLLIAALAMFALWLLGLAARAAQWHRHFQANIEQRRHVLSAIFLGRAIYRDPRYEMPDDAIELAAELLLLGVVELRRC